VVSCSLEEVEKIFAWHVFEYKEDVGGRLEVLCSATMFGCSGRDWWIVTCVIFC
jgi:hypothetical protein